MLASYDGKRAIENFTDGQKSYETEVNKTFLNRLVIKVDAKCWQEAIPRSLNLLQHIVEQNVILQPSLLKIASFSYTAVTF